ncbi:hypothetical protein GCM10010203_55180 [Actinomadura yumaensis]|jgi:hypothetical protein
MRNGRSVTPVIGAISTRPGTVTSPMVKDLDIPAFRRIARPFVKRDSGGLTVSPLNVAL